MNPTNTHLKIGLGMLYLLLSATAVLAQGRYALRGQEAQRVIKNADLVIADSQSDPKFIRFKSGTSFQSISSFHESLGMPERSNLTLKSTLEDQLGQQHLRYVQTYNDIEVLGADFVLHKKGDLLNSANGTILKRIKVDTNPTISVDQARELALQKIGATSYMWEDKANEQFIKQESGNPSASFYPIGNLYISSEDYNQSNPYRLVYKFDIYASDPLGRYNVEVDAHTGEVINFFDKIHHTTVPGTGESLYDGQVNLTLDSDGFQYYLSDDTRGNGIYTYDMFNGLLYSSAKLFTEDDNHFDEDNSKAGVSAHFGASVTYDYFLNKFGRNSYDGAGASIKSYVHYGFSYANAFWDGSRMTYGDGANYNNTTAYTSLDIVGHEIAHAVTQYSANLIYYYESGALNESFSDIFGQSIEFETFPATASWNLGDQIYTDGVSMIRSMSNPNSEGQPDTYKGDYWFDQSGDNGGVHFNSGVQNFWYYLLVEGGNGTNDNGYNYSVPSIGRSAADQIAYRNLTVYLTPNSQYVDARLGAELAAIDLFGEGSFEHSAVVEAWNAVGVDAPMPMLDVLSSVNYGDIPIGLPQEILIKFSNQGTGTLIIEDIEINNSTFSTVADTTYAIRQGNALDIPFIFIPIALGDTSAVVTIQSNQGVKVINLSGTGVSPPIVNVGPSSLNDTLLSGETSVQKLTIANQGNSPLIYSVQDNIYTIEGPYQIDDFFVTGEDGWSFSERAPIYGYDADFHLDKHNKVHAWFSGALNLGKVEFDNSSVPSSGYTSEAVTVEEGDVLAIIALDGQFAKIQVDKISTFGFTFYQIYPVQTRSGSTFNVNSEIISVSSHQPSQTPDILTVTSTNVMDGNKTIASFDWLNASVNKDTIPSGESRELDINIDATLLDAGQYQGSISIRSNDPALQLVEVPVSLSVNGEPSITLNKNVVNYGATFIGANSVQKVTVSNDGTAPLIIENIIIEGDNYSIEPYQNQINPREIAEIYITYSPTDTLQNVAVLTLVSNDEDRDTLHVDLLGNGMRAPVISLSVDELTEELYTGQVSSQVMTIDNILGESDLEWKMILSEKDAIAVKASDPDKFGYTWSDSDQEGGPDFEWQDISSTGVNISNNLSDDNIGGPFPINFEFKYYDQIIKEFGVASNGYIQLGTNTSGGYRDSPVPYPDLINNIISWSGGDLFPRGGAFYQNFDDKIIIQYNDHGIYYDGSMTTQIVLYKNGNIKINYLNVSSEYRSPSTVSVGIENIDGTDGLSVAFRKAYTHDSLSVLFTRPAEWFSSYQNSGVLAPGDLENLAITFDSRDLESGLYEGVIAIESGDPVNPLLSIPVSLHVRPSSDIVLSKSSVDFGSQPNGLLVKDTVTIFNRGSAQLIISSITTENPDFQFNMNSIELAPKEQTDLVIIYQPSDIGSDTTVVSFMTNDIDESEVQIVVNAFGVAPPVITVNPTNINNQLIEGENSTQQVTIDNSAGQSDLSWQLNITDENSLVAQSGEPNIFGYAWVDSDHTEGIEFRWVDISSTGEDISNEVFEDDISHAYPLDFEFEYYGKVYSEFYISSYGTIKFESEGYDDYDVHDIGWASRYLNPYNGRTYIQNSADSTVIQFNDWDLFFFEGNGSITAQVILYKTGDIKMNYSSLKGQMNDGNYKVEIQDVDESDPLTISRFKAYLHDELSVFIKKPVSWITIDQSSGITPAGETEDVTLHVNNRHLLSVGNYQADINIVSNDPNNQFLQVPVDLAVLRLVKPLQLSAVCSDNPLVQRGWNIFNPNLFPIEAFWFIVGSGQYDSISIAPGDNILYTNTLSNQSNMLKLRWLDSYSLQAETSADSKEIPCDIRGLILHSLCSDNPDIFRKWEIENRNPFPVNVLWELEGTDISGYIDVQSGKATFYTETQPGDQYVKITWMDEEGRPRRQKKLSHHLACNVRGLILNAVCSDNPEIQRRWEIVNRNSFPVTVSWKLEGTALSGTMEAIPGKSFFFTDTQEGDQYVKITWLDEGGQHKRQKKLSVGEQCDDNLSASRKGITESTEESVQNNNLNIVIFPNPFEDKITLSMKVPEDISTDYYKIIVHNMLGRMVYESRAESQFGQLNTEINASYFAKGTYILTIMTEDQQKVYTNLLLKQ